MAARGHGQFPLCTYIMYLSPKVAWAAVHSKAVVLLLIFCLMYIPLFVGVLCLFLFWYALPFVFYCVFVLVCITFCPLLFCNHLEEEERAGCFAFVVLRMFCYCKYSVALPQGSMVPDHTH